ANAAGLTLTGVQTTDGGSYTVVVSNPGGAIESAPAVLTVVAAGPTVVLQERFADGERAAQALPASAAWFSSSGGSNVVTTVGQLTHVVSSARTVLAYLTNAAGTPVTIGAGQTLTLDFTVQFSGFDINATGATPSTFVVGLLRSVANPTATAGLAGFTPDGPPNTIARVNGDFTSNNPTNGVFLNYGGYAAMTTVEAASFATPVRLYARTGASASLLNSTSPFTVLTGAAPTASAAMTVGTDYHGTMTLQNTGSGMAVAYTLREASTNAVVMSYSTLQPAATSTQIDTVAFYVSKATTSATYNFVVKAVDVSLF
ncbi:MAG TPA: hypothetical protein VGQ33_16690, partial [Vicinamibacteria bacterium]|nr:hypothetical protein [Vicinamibacteria bacterium]